MQTTWATCTGLIAKGGGEGLVLREEVQLTDTKVS